MNIQFGKREESEYGSASFYLTIQNSGMYKIIINIYKEQNQILKGRVYY